MTNNFMTESFWDEPQSWRCSWRHGMEDDKATLHNAWEQAVDRLAGHLATRMLRPEEESRRAARGFLEESVDSMLKFTPGSEKREIAEDVAETYLTSKDLEWTMAAHSLLRVSVAQGETNQHPQAPANKNKAQETPKAS